MEIGVENAAASPAAATETTSFAIPKDSAEYAEWRKTGKISEPKSAEATAADTSKETTSETAAASETAQPQEKKGKGAEARIKELLAEKKAAEDRAADFERRLADREQAESTRKAESSPVKPEPKQPQTYKEWRETYKPSQWINEWAAKPENKDATYEDAQAAMADYLGDMRDAFRDREMSARSQQAELQKKLNDAKTRYPDFDSKITPTVKALQEAQIAPVIKQMVNDSDVLPDLLYVMGGDQAKFNEFLQTAKTNPRQAIKELVLMEQLVSEELSKSEKTLPERGEGGKFQSSKPPEKKISDAPPPPTEVNSRGAAPADPVASAVEKNDFASFRAARNLRDLQSRKGN